MPDDEKCAADSQQTKKDFLDLATRLYNHPLAIDKRTLDVITQAKADMEGLIEFLDEFSLQPQTTNGVAVIPVRGSLFRGFFFDDYSQIRAAFDAALEDASVRAIVLDIDSPGGDASGMLDLSDHIFKARGEKPIVALANDQMTSAAYAIGSAADQVFHTRGGILGSIGVVAIHVDTSKMDEKAGVKFTEIASGERKTDLSSHQPLSELGRATLRKAVDLTAGHFFQTVARNRGMSVDAVRDQQAAVFFGGESEASGLSDGETTLDALVTRLGGEVGSGDEPGGFSMGARLAGRLNNRIDQMETEERSRTDIIDDMASAAGIDASTVGQILNGSINCPPIDRLRGFSRVLNLSLSSLTSAAGEDGCDYNSEEDASMKQTQQASAGETASASVSATNTTTTATAPSVTEIEEAAAKKAQARNAEINDLCTLAGVPELAGKFCASDKKIEDIRAELMKQRADEGDRNPVSGHHRSEPDGDGASGKTKIDTAAIYARRQAAYQAAAKGRLLGAGEDS